MAFLLLALGDQAREHLVEVPHHAVMGDVEDGGLGVLVHGDDALGGCLLYTSISKGVNVGGLLIVCILGAVSVLIVSNTIKVTIFNRRREISIMKYVGATDAFIRIPFLVEGILIGLISALLSFGLLWVGYEYAVSYTHLELATYRICRPPWAYRSS